MIMFILLVILVWAAVLAGALVAGVLAWLAVRAVRSVRNGRTALSWEDQVRRARAMQHHPSAWPARPHVDEDQARLSDQPGSMSA